MDALFRGGPLNREHNVELRGGTLRGFSVQSGYLQLDSLSSLVSRGGPGKLSMTSCESCDRDTITSFSFTAVCIRRTVPSSL